MMKQGHYDKPTPREPIRGRNGQANQGSKLLSGSLSGGRIGKVELGSAMLQTRPLVGGQSWSGYKIPKRGQDSTDRQTHRAKRNRSVTSGADKKEAKMVKLTVGCSTTSSALGDLMKNYSVEDDEDEEEVEEKKKTKIHDVYGGVWQVMEPPKTNTSTHDETVNSTTPWRTKPKVNSAKDKNKARSKSTNDIDSSAASSVNFTSGVGAFLNALKSESQKPKPSYPTVRPSVRAAGGILKTSSPAALSNQSSDWSVKNTMKTYSNKLTNQKLLSPGPLSSKKTNHTDWLDGDNSHKRARILEKETEESDKNKEISRKSVRTTNTRQTQRLSKQSETDDQLQNEQQMKDKDTVTGPVSATNPISSRTRRGGQTTEDERGQGKEDESGQTKENGKDGDEAEGAGEDLWEQQDIVLLSIKCKGPVSNKQLSSCINGIFLDLQEEGASALEALTADEVRSKLECIYQQDLSDKRTMIDYIFQKLKRDGPKKQKDSSPVVVTIGKIGLTRTDLYTLAENAWLNDNIINSYFHLLVKSATKKVFAFSTFFYSTLTQRSKGGYDNVKRWTDQVDIFAQDLVLIPVHQNRNHWTLAVVQVQQHRIEFYNSLGSNNAKCLGIVIQYLRKEAAFRKRHLFTALSWGSGLMKGLPQQTNGSDCGVYICQYAKKLCQGEAVKFASMEALTFRQSMVKEIVAAKITQ